MVSDRRSRGLVSEFRATFRTLLAGIGLVALGLAALGGVLLGQVQPDLRYDTDMVRAARELHEGMLEQESGVRGWLSRGGAPMLDRYEAGRLQAADAGERLVELVGHDAELDRSIVAVRVAQEAWQDRWAAPSTGVQPREIGSEELRSILATGEELFDGYRADQGTLLDAAAAERDQALELERRVVAFGLGGAGSVVVVVGIVVTRQRRRLERRIADPVAELVEGMRQLGDGQPFVVAASRAPSELRMLADGLADAAAKLRTDQEQIAAAHQRAERTAETLRSVLDVAREIAGSLNVRYVAESVATAGQRIAGVDRVVVWIADNDHLLAVHDGSLPHGVVPDLSPVEVGHGPVGIAARDARPTPPADGSGLAFPLVVGGRVVGVLEVADAPDGLDEERTEALETLAIHAAAALEASRLHRAAEELAQVDALTQLANRRRMDDDLAAELERSARYGRPLGLIMVDIDHFKLLNDTFGHQRGDEVLREVAQVLSGSARSSDTVYRYGGEEFCVLVREGTLEAAGELAERLRSSLAAAFADTDGSPSITASFGVAGCPDQAVGAGPLIAAADAALYDAKRAGRDRVVIADRAGTPTPASIG